jgi:hypothetical protein
MAGTITQSATQAWVQMMSSELYSLANNSGAVQNTTTNAAYGNGNSGNRYFSADFELRVTFATAPTAGATIDLYVVPYGSDGTNSVTVATTALPPGLYLGSFVVQAVTSLQVLFLRNTGPLPDDYFTVAVFNNGTGQTLPSSSSTIKMRPVGEAYT